MGDGTGALGAPVTVPVGDGPNHVATSDLNDDGKQDLAVANFYSGTVSVFRGDGAGTFEPLIELVAGPGPTSVTIDDIDSDGKLDLVVGLAYSDEVPLFLGDGSGAFAATNPVETPGAVQIAKIADFNGDGLRDLAVAHTGGSLVSILPGNGAGAFGPAMQCIVGNGLSYSDPVALGDFDEDGRLDLAMVNSLDDTVSILLNTTDSAPTNPPAADLVVSSLSAGISANGVVINDTQQNIGTEPAGAFTVAFNFASSPGLPANGTVIGTRSISGLTGNGATTNASTWFAIPAGIPTGSYLVCAITDSGGTVNEVDKTNNSRCTTQSYTIGPDLLVHALSAIKWGSSLYVTDTQRNLGNGPSEVSTVSFYLSSNMVWDAGDKPLGSRSVPGLAGGGAMNKKTTLFPLPSGIASGYYYVLAISDSWNAVTELNEANNAKATTGTYRLP